MRTAALTLALLAVVATVVATDAATAGAERIAGGKIRLFLADRTADPLFEEEGVAIEPTRPAKFGGCACVVFPAGGQVAAHGQPRAVVRGRGGLLLRWVAPHEHEYAASLKFGRPTFVVSSNAVRLFMNVRGTRLRISTLRFYETSTSAQTFRLDKGRAQLSAAAARLIAGTFDVPWVRRGTPLGSLYVRAKLGAR